MRSIVVVILAVFSAAQAWAQLALTPATPAITPSPVFVPGSPAIAPVAVNPGVTSSNLTLAALSDSLLSLQNNLAQTLPILTTFNDSLDFVSLGDNGLAGAATAPSGNFSANLGTNFASNLAVNAAATTGGSLFNTVAAANRTPPPASSTGQGATTIPVTRDTLRALLVLQSDIQRMLPLLNALNGGTTNFPGSFTNLFSVIPISR